jgi:uncharacterized membrane protein
MTAFLTGWSELVAAFVLFVTSHMVPARPIARSWLLRHIGKTGYLLVYTGLSILVFGWLIVAAGRAPYVPLWDPAAWQLWVPNVAMPFVCLLLAYGIAAPNPLSIASRNDRAYDPDHPGIVGCTRHPVLWAATLWASAHVLPNGDLAYVIVFCLFAALGVFGALIVDIRKQRYLGTAEWLRLSAHTSFVPLVALFSGRWRPSPDHLNFFRLFAATVLYVSFLMLHETVIGVSPLPLY